MDVEGVLNQLICSSAIIDLIRANGTITPEVFQQAVTLSVKIADNISITPVNPNLNELKEFIKHEIEKLSTDKNIADSIEYSNYTIKPTGLTIWYYLILLTDDNLLSFYTNWLSIKQICILIVEQYKSNIDSGFLHYIVSIHDLFHKFSSPQITEVQTGGGRTNTLAVLVALLLLSMSSIFITLNPSLISRVSSRVSSQVSSLVSSIPYPGLNPPELRERSRQVPEYNNANTLYEHLKNVVSNRSRKTATAAQYHTVNTSLKMLGQKFGVSTQQREQEGNKILRFGKDLSNALAAASRQKLVRGSVLITGGIIGQFIPGMEMLEEDRTEYASTKAVNHMYEIGLTTGDVYRILLIASSLYDEQVAAYEKTVEKARQKPSIQANSLGLMTEDVFKVLKSGGLDFIVDGILDSNGIGFLKIPVKGLIHNLPTTTTLASKEEELTNLKYYQSIMAMAKEWLPYIAQYVEGENLYSQKYKKEDPIDLLYEGGRKTKRQKTKRRKRKRTRRKNLANK
jgi:hypothetical protein